MSNPTDLCRLNYIGSKHQLYDFIKSSIYDFTKYSSFQNVRIGDLFSGTGIISYYLRKDGANVISNDMELYSYIITNAMNHAVYNDTLAEKISYLNQNVDSLKMCDHRYITLHYSPYNDCERMFYTVENAQIIDGFRHQIELWKSELSNNDYIFLLASLIVSADQFSNIPAVSGCYLKTFKAKALKKMMMIPIHQNRESAHPENRVLSLSAHSEALKSHIFDIVYCDPPYNERQYSKNYFVLNMIAKYGDYPEIRGKTGIPVNSFVSPFCQKKSVKDAFQKMVEYLNARYIFISYSSDGLVSRDEMVELLSKYGAVQVYEKEYKRFKSFDYNQSGDLMEYIFALEKIV